MRAKKRSPFSRAAAFVLAGAACACMLGAGCSSNEPAPAAIATEAPSAPEATLAEPVASMEPVPSESARAQVMLPRMAELYAQNPEIVGWLQIEGTNIDYPVMFTPQDGQYYLYRTFDKQEDPTQEGCLFVDEHCTVDPRSTNLLIHGHNMKNGTMFNNLMNYMEESYYKEHPIIRFTTLYEEQEYEIAYVFTSKVYNVDDNVWKFYKFYNAANAQEYDDFTAHCKELELYDTGVTAQYDDELITLTTCSHLEEDGRLVVVARRVTDEFPLQGEAAKAIASAQQQVVEGTLTGSDTSTGSGSGDSATTSGDGDTGSASGEVS